MPPAWLNDTTLPVELVPASTPLFRIHRQIHHPIFFGPGAGLPPTYRFDSLSGAFGVLYVGMSLVAAVVETLMRNPNRRMVSYSELATRASCELVAGRDLRVARLYGRGLQTLGCDNAISTGPYEPCGAWSDALWTHPDRPDGIAYQSRHDSGELCIALFERTDFGLRAGPSVPLTDQLPTISGIFSAYGKSVTDLPS